MDLITTNNIDIALLQETWLRKVDSAIVSEIKEFNFEVFQERKPRKIDVGEGVAIVFNNDLNVKKLKTDSFDSFELAACSLQSDMGKLTISTLYYSGYSAKHKYIHAQFLSDISDYLNSLCQIVTGDFNVHYENLDEDDTKLHEILILNEFTQLVCK